MHIGRYIHEYHAFQFSITVGSIIAKKAKILVAIGIYYATNSILPIINQLLMAFLGYGISFWGVNSAPMSSDMEAAMVIFYLLLIEIIIMAIVSVVLYLVTQYLFERKLNLA